MSALLATLDMAFCANGRTCDQYRANRQQIDAAYLADEGESPILYEVLLVPQRSEHHSQIQELLNKDRPAPRAGLRSSMRTPWGSPPIRNVSSAELSTASTRS